MSELNQTLNSLNLTLKQPRGNANQEGPKVPTKAPGEEKLVSWLTVRIAEGFTLANPRQYRTTFPAPWALLGGGYIHLKKLFF